MSAAVASVIDTLDALAEGAFGVWGGHRARCGFCRRGAVTLGGDEFRCSLGTDLHDAWWKAEGHVARARVAAEGGLAS